MKLYTKTGDDGTTGLFGGQRVDKDHLRVEAYGTVDELNSFIGLALAVCRNEGIGNDGEMADFLLNIQHRLFEMGADLATPREGSDDQQAQSAVPRITDEHVRQIEQWIDHVCEPLPQMKHFILPSGNELVARLHVARTVCRRAERRCITLARHEPINEAAAIYLNRLSDLLFALARSANWHRGVEDTPWIPPR